MKLRLPTKRRYRVLVYGVSGVLVALAVDLVWVRTWRHVAISEATTRITSPLKADGMPDYITYLDDRQREGVTVENNAAVPYLEMVSAEKEGWFAKERLAELYQRMGLTSPPEGQPIVHFSDILKAKTPPELETEERNTEETYVRKNPWSRDQHPDMVRYLDANEKALAVMPRVVARPRWYVPMLRPKDDLMIGVLLPSLGMGRERCNELLTRAMLEIQEKKFAPARADIMAVHRFARLQVQGWTLIEYLVGLAEERMALDADTAYVATEGLPREELEKFVTEWDALPAWPAITRSLDSERFGVLDALVYVAGHPRRSALVASIDSGEPGSWSGPTGLENLGWWLSWHFRPGHFDAVLREVNGYYDQMVEASRGATPVEREDRGKDANKAIEAYVRDNRGVLEDPARRLGGMLLPSLGRAVTLADVREMNAGLARVSMALALYKAQKGEYPQTLGELTAKEIGAVPGDGFSGAPLKYRRTEGGYVVYSVGVNRKDDGGVADKSTDKGDLVVQVPRQGT